MMMVPWSRTVSFSSLWGSTIVPLRKTSSCNFQVACQSPCVWNTPSLINIKHNSGLITGCTGANSRSQPNHQSRQTCDMYPWLGSKRCNVQTFTDVYALKISQQVQSHSDQLIANNSLTCQNAGSYVASSDGARVEEAAV